MNRVPDDRLQAGPKCGTCGTPLLDGKVRTIGPDVLAGAPPAAEARVRNSGTR